MISERIELFLSIVIICLITILFIMVNEVKILESNVNNLQQRNIELIKRVE